MPNYRITETYTYQRIVVISADTEEEAIELYDIEPENIIGKAKETYDHIQTFAEELL